VKYRIAAGREEHGNYILTAFYLLAMTFPTGQYQEGALRPVITPTIAYGKGFGNFDVQGTLGGSLPTGSVSVIGNTLLWNNAFQYKIFKNFCPEMEVNFTHDYGGSGKIVPTSHPGQTLVLVYLTPGLVLGRFRLKDRLSFSLSPSGAVLRSQRRHFIPQTTFPFYGYVSPSEAVGRNPHFHINPVRIGK
jgi:hypothetical protein